MYGAEPRAHWALDPSLVVPYPILVKPMNLIRTYLGAQSEPKNHNGTIMS